MFFRPKVRPFLRTEVTSNKCLVVIDEMTRAYVSSSPCLDGLRKLGSKPQRENHATLSSAFAIAAGGKKLSSDSLF